MNAMPEIIELARKYSGKSNVLPESRLLSDLGLDGDDAGELIEALSKRFDISWEGFHWLRYFGDEYLDPFAPALSTVAQWLSADFRQRWKNAREVEREITIAHLARVAEARRWIEPPDTARREVQSIPARVLGAVMGAVAPPSLVLLGAFAVIALMSGHVTNPLVAIGLLGLITAIVWMIWVSWTNIRRKLASAPPA